MRWLIGHVAIATLLCPLTGAFAVPVTYEFTGILNFSTDPERPVDYARGYITIETDAQVRNQWTSATYPDAVWSSATLGYANPILALDLQYGNDYASAGTAAESNINFNGNRTDAPEVNWLLTMFTPTYEGRYFQLVYSGFCDPGFCPDFSISEFFAYDDWMDVPALSDRSLEFSVRDGLLSGPCCRHTYEIKSFRRVPEPGTIALFSIAFLAMFVSHRRRG